MNKPVFVFIWLTLIIGQIVFGTFADTNVLHDIYKVSTFPISYIIWDVVRGIGNNGISIGSSIEIDGVKQ